jgi:hypothetical protein
MMDVIGSRSQRREDHLREHPQSGWVSRALDLPHCLPHKVLIRDLVLLLALQKIDAFFRSA